MTSEQTCWSHSPQRQVPMPTYQNPRPHHNNIYTITTIQLLTLPNTVSRQPLLPLPTHQCPPTPLLPTPYHHHPQIHPSGVSYSTSPNPVNTCMITSPLGRTGPSCPNYSNLGHQQLLRIMDGQRVLPQHLHQRVPFTPQELKVRWDTSQPVTSPKWE